MTEQEFKEKLYKEELTEDEKYDIIKFFIEYYAPIQYMLMKNPEGFVKLLNHGIVKGGNPYYVNKAIEGIKSKFPK